MLKIADFGPIKELELEIKDYTVFIGPQASGKSTIGKLIYYFLSLKDDVTQYIIEAATNRQQLNIDNACMDIKKKLRSKFVQLFGTTKHMGEFNISYTYDKKKKVSLSLRDGYVSVSFSSEFNTGLRYIIQYANGFLKQNPDAPAGYATQHDLIVQQAIQRKFYLEIGERVNALVGNDDRTVIYVPACRSLLATLSDYIYRLINDSFDMEQQGIPDSTLDYSAKAFIDRISHLKKIFTQSLDDLIQDKKKFSVGSIPVDTVSLLQIKQLIYTILKGEYRYSKDEERLYYSDTEYVKLSLSSSGQQESVWILQLVFSLVLNNMKTTLLIEEPEAHLYPEAQMNMIWLISLFGKLNGNRVIMTTHSPYILASINNLIYAHQVGQSKAEEVCQIIPSYSWIDYERVGAFLVDKGGIRSILNTDLKQIEAELIDDVSNILNRQYNQLLDLEE